MKLYIRNRAPFEVEQLEIDEDAGLIFATGRFKDIHGQPQSIAVPVTSVDFLDLTEDEPVREPARWEGSE